MWQSKYFILFLLLIIHTNSDTKTYLTSDILINMDGKEDEKSGNNKVERRDSLSPSTKMLLREQVELQKKQLEQLESMNKKMAEKKSSLKGFWGI